MGVLALLMTLWMTQHERALQQREMRRNFDFGVRQAATRVEQRMASYEQMLRGVRGLFDASDSVSRQGFGRYVDLLQRGADFAGLRSIGYAPLRSQGGHDSAQALYLTPASGLQPSLRDADLLASAALRGAMERARDAGGAVITPLLQPQAGDNSADLGVLLFMPIYGQGLPLASVAERHQRLVGWVFASFRVADLVSSLYGEGTPGLDLRLHDGANIDAASRMFPAGALAEPARPARLEAQEYLGVAGHTWTLWARSTPAFEQQQGQDAAQVIAVAGCGLALVLTLLTWLLVTGRDRAHDAARAMTHQLHDSEHQYRRIVETASEGIWIVDAQGHTSFANQALQRLLGCTERQLLGRPWADFLDEAGRAALLGDVDQPALQGRELRLRRADGSILQARVSTNRIQDEQGRAAGVLAMVTDDSQRHHDEARRNLLEGQLRQSQKMEAIGTLAGGIAHDFNNIMASILGNLALVRQDLGTQHGVAPRLDQIAQAGGRARSLVQQIVAFSRQQPQALVVQPLQPLLDEAVTLLRATLPAAVLLRLDCSTQTPPVAVDATQLQQVLLNLCTNAWHALPGGVGRIVIGLDSVWLDAAQAERLGGVHSGAHAHLWVSDTGCGMDETTSQRIFEPFFTTKPTGKGTGLGLAVVHGIVAGHGGAISVDSAPGQGSCFHLYLPAPTPATRPTPAAPPLVVTPGPDLLRRGSGQHVLYVDDDAVMGLMVEGLLQRQGWRCSTLDKPQLALARALDVTDPVDLVVSDFNMPGLSGLDLARALAAQRPGLPVIISSGYVTDSLRSAAADAGVRHVLQKEHTLEQLGALLQQVLADG